MKKIFELCKNKELIFPGGQREVYKADHPEYGKVVIKVAKIKSETMEKRILREVEFLKSVDSKYFPKFYGFYIDGGTNTFSTMEEFIISKKLYELKEYFDSERKIIDLLAHLILGLKELWDKNSVHRDLKPDNILIIDDYTPKIIDLGIARFLEYESLTKTIAIMGPCTPIYASPEQLLNKKNQINMRSDFFSLGIVILEMHLGYHPFHPERVGNDKAIPENIVEGIFVNPKIKANTSDAFSSLIEKMLKIYPFQRFRNYEILTKYIKDQYEHFN